MSVLEMPMEKLKVYRGINPRPRDFDAYWDEGIHELGAIDPVSQLCAATFQLQEIECFDLRFTSTFSARIHAKYLRPRIRKEALPVLFMFHGYNLRAADWIQLLPYAAAGFAVAALDVRGQAGESEDPGGVVGTTYHGHIVRGLSDPDTRKLFFRNVFLDAVMLTRVVGSFQETDVSRMATIGTSQGGAVALACAALADIKMTAVCYPFLCDYQRVWQMNLVHQSYAELKDYFRAFDPTHVHKTELFTKLGYIDVQHLAPRIRAKVRMFTGMMDDNCPPSAQFAVFNKIAGPKEITLYPDYGHERLPGWEDEVLQWLLAEL